MATCLDYALKYINTYPKTEQELTTKLYTKKFTEDDIAFTISFLKKKWFLDDEKFTRLYIQSELVKKGKVPALVRKKLIFKGVDRNIIESCLREHEEEINEGIYERIRKEIARYKKKWLEGYDAVVKVAQKWYRIGEIKKALQNNEE